MATLTERFDPIDADTLYEKADELTDCLEREFVADAHRRERLYGVPDATPQQRQRGLLWWREPQRP